MSIFGNSKDKFSRIKSNLTSIDSQPLSKAALIILLFLDIFILTSIFDGLGGLWPLGLVLFGALAIPGMGVALFAARIRTGRTKG